MREWGNVIIVLSFLAAMFQFMEIWANSKAGLGDINFSIAYFSLTILWFLLGAFLVILERLKRIEKK